MISLNAITIISLLTFSFASAMNVPRQDPTPTLSEIAGISPPTSTNATVVAAYKDIQQECGPDIDAALQAALPLYADANDLPTQPNITDPAFLQWARLNSVDYQNANDQCMGAKDDYFKIEDSTQTSSSPPALPTLSSTMDSVNPAGTATTTTGGTPSGTTTGKPPIHSTDAAVSILDSLSAVLLSGSLLAAALAA
ncbi:hypothetical protein C8R46DRAFT_1024134 [Mycena filopes]|nr:hypothetical protein C8R46DRAFT_1024134 [Mycena filopes]